MIPQYDVHGVLTRTKTEIPGGEKEEWEKFKKLSEESFRAEKKDFENQKQNEMKKMYLETRKLIDSCTNLKEFLEKYEEIQDVSE